MKNEKIPFEHHVLRYVAWGRLRKDENDVVLGCLPQAFQLRENEEYLSVTWVESFEGSLEEQRDAAIKATRQSIVTGPKSAFAKGNVGETYKVCSEQRANVRILHAPSQKNSGHSAIRRIPRDNADLLTLLADEVFTDLTLNSAVP